MARQLLTAQALGTTVASATAPPPPAVDVNWFDANVLGHQYVSTGREMVLLRTGSGAGTFTAVSAADQFGRLGNQVHVLPAYTERAIGPFLPNDNWGDGEGTIYVDPSGLAGSVSIALIKV